MTKIPPDMVRTDLLPKKRPVISRARAAWALAASCILHATVLGLLVGLVVDRAKDIPPPTGSQANAPSITLSTMMVTPTPPSKPPQPLPKPPKSPLAPAPSPTIAQLPRPQPQSGPVLPVSQPQSAPMEEAVPVLANTAIRPQTVAALPVAHAAAPRVAKASPMQPKPSAPASFASSFAPGENVLPHPPYPQEAQDLGETGTVVMTVTFNISGDVIQATVAQSSGVRLLDTMTRSFILSHWHSASLAGQTVSQPVRYMGE